MKKLRRVIGSVTKGGASGSRDGAGSPTSAGGHSGPLSKGNRSLSIASSLHAPSPADGSYVSYDNRSMGSQNSFASSSGADIDPYSKNDKNFTKLHKWAYLGDVPKLKKFIKKVPINSQDSEGRSALHLASSQGHDDALLFLLGSKGNTEMQDNAGMTPLLRATEKGHIQLVQMLLQRRVDINILDYDGNGAAHLAVRTGSTDLLELLLDCGVDCDTQNKLGRTPIHLGCQEGHEGVVESLLRRGAEVNVIDKEEVTPLMMASKFGSRQLVDILLDQGADISSKDSSKWTAADYARFTNHNQLNRHLKSLMEDAGRNNSGGLFPQGLYSSPESDENDDDLVPLGGAASGVIAEEGEENSWKDNNNSWSDGSEAASIKEKPKVNISKFIQSSDESPDVPLHHQSSQEGLSHASSQGGLSQNTGPPKPPRLYTSSSSLDQPLDDRTPQSGAEEEKVKHTSKGNKSDDDSWGDSTDTEPKLKQPVKFSTDSEIEDPAVQLDVNSPEKLKFDMDIPTNTRRWLSQDNLDDSQPEDQVRKDKLLTQMELGSMEFHSSEEISFGEDEEGEILPDKPSSKMQQKNSPLQTPASSPLKSSTHSSLKSPVNIDDERIKPPHISSKSSTPTKKQRTPSKEKLLNMQNSLDSDSDDNVQPSNRPLRKKSLIPSGKKFGNFPFLPSHSASEADDDEEEEKSTGKIKPKKELFPNSDESLKQKDNKESKMNRNKESVSLVDSDNDDQSDGKANNKRTNFALSHEKETKSNEKVDEDSNKESGSWMDSDIDFSSSLPIDGPKSDNEINLSPEKNIPSTIENPSVTIDSNNIPKDSENTNDKDEDINSFDNGDLAAQKSRGSTLSTVVGTLGRDGTMQETEELWEANASISPRRRNSNISTEESSKSETTNLTQDQVKASEEKSKDVLTNNSEDLSSNKQLNLTETITKGSIKSVQEKISPTIEEESGSFSLEKTSISPEKMIPHTKDPVPFRPLLRRRSSVTSDQLIQIMTNTSLNKQSRRRPSRQASVSGLGSIVFSDEEESLSADHHLTPRSHLAVDELDDGISAASTETEESAHINSGLKDSLLTPLSSLPNNMDIGQLQDLIRELRLKLEKESGCRRALEDKLARLKKMEKQERQQCHRLEEELQHKQTEIVSLSSRVSALDYQSRCDEDSGRLKTQSLEDAQNHCQQLEEELASLRASLVHDDQALESLRAQINTKDCINQSLQERINQRALQTKNVSAKSIQTEEVPSACTTSSEVQTTNVTQIDTGIQTEEQPSTLSLIEEQTKTEEAIVSSESSVSMRNRDQMTNSSQTECPEHKSFGMQTENEELQMLQTDDPKIEKLKDDVWVQTDKELLDDLIQKLNISSKQLMTQVTTATQTEANEMILMSAQTDLDLQPTVEKIPESLELCSTEHTSTQTHMLLQSQLTQTDDLRLSTLYVQTDMMMSNSEVVPKKQLVTSDCQTVRASKQMGCQTDLEVSLAMDDQESAQSQELSSAQTRELSSAPNVDVAHQLHRVLSPMITNLTQDMKTVIDESLEHNGDRDPQVKEALIAALSDHMRSLEDRLVSKMQQSVLIQNADLGDQQSDRLKHLQQQLTAQLDTLSQQQQQEANKQVGITGHQQSETLKHLLQQLTAQLDTLSQQQQQEANKQFQSKSSENQDYQQQLSRLQSNFQRGLDDLHSDLRTLYDRQDNSSRQAHLDTTLMTLTETNKQVQASLVRSVEDCRLSSYEALQQMQTHLTTQLLEAQNVIKLAIMSKSNSNNDQEEVSRSILEKMDAMEKSIVNSLTPVVDSSQIEGEVRQLSSEMNKKISVLQKSLESSELEQKQQELLKHLNELRESHAGLSSLVKSRSASSVDISEAVEENFHILQDHVRKLQTVLMAKVNELSHQTSIAEEQNSTWLSKQLSELTTQIATMQCNLSRLQTFVESSASLPTSGHLDETILTTMKVSSDQSLASLKFQNQSVISLLEGLQKEVHNALGQFKSSDVETKKEVQIVQEQLIGREQEVSRLNLLKEDQQNKIHQLNCRIDRLTQQEDDHRQHSESLQKKLLSLETCLKQREQKLEEEAAKLATHSEEVIHLRKETFRLNMENNKLVTLHQTEQQQSQWYEGQVKGLRESCDTAEAKVQELVTQLQLSRPLQRMPPTGRDLNDEDDENYRKEIKKLQADKQAMENKLSDTQNKALQLEMHVEDLSSRLGLEKNHKVDLERELRKAKDTLSTLRRGLNETTHEHSQFQDALDKCKELEAEASFKEAVIATLKNKLEEINQQKLEMKQEMMLFKEERLSFDLLKHEKEMVEKMHKHMEEQLQELRKRLSRDYIPKSNLELIQKDFESRYQLELSTRLSELNQLIEEQNKQQESQRKIKESREQNLKNEMSRMSDEVIRLRARLSIYDEEDDTWKTRYERLMDLYHKEQHGSGAKKYQRLTKKSSSDQLGYNLEEIEAQLATPLATSTLLSQFSPPSSLQIPVKGPSSDISDIGSYQYTHQDALDRTLHKYLKDDKMSVPKYSKNETRHPEDNISSYLSKFESLQHTTSMYDSLRQNGPVGLDKSCEDYMNILKKKYGF